MLLKLNASRFLPCSKDSLLSIARLSMMLMLALLPASLTWADEARLRVAIKGEPSSLDPHHKKVIWDQFVAYRMFDTLTEYSKQMRTVPALAEGWTTVIL